MTSLSSHTELCFLSNYDCSILLMMLRTMIVCMSSLLLLSIVDCKLINECFLLVIIHVDYCREPHKGHYVSLVKSYGTWLLFDDENVKIVEPCDIENFFGISAGKESKTGYILLYQSKE